ncbi:MAG TPA: thymidine phosphorylase [Actinomycetota bacterium]|nr:thymidine phosphorylase [Actinomycetota bacterium]
MAVGTAFDPRDVVARKRDGHELSRQDLRRLVMGYLAGEVPDYLVAAFLMAVYLRGLSDAETADLTRVMVESGITLPLSRVRRPKVDKHSTGGVSDGVTLVFAPLAASLGLAVAKLSGRGLGHTGGTLDKLESIPGLRTDLSPEELERQVEEVGCAVAGQTADLVPADGALYALRDATGTVASVPLIAASVMSKKLAVGSDLILLDVKAGSGAFMKTPEEAAQLARACVRLASHWGRRAKAAVTDMSQPLGRAIGNALDVAEAVAVLRGEERGRLRELSLTFAAEALTELGVMPPAPSGPGGAGSGPAAQGGRGGFQGGSGQLARSRAAAEAALDSGRAAETFARMVQAQGGDPRVVEEPWSVLPQAPLKVEVRLDRGGYLRAVDAEALGRAAVALGAGRVRKGDPIDPAVGIRFLPEVGDAVGAEEPVAVVHARDEEAAARAARAVLAALTLGEEPPERPPLVFSWYSSEEAGPGSAPRGGERGRGA